MSSSGPDYVVPLRVFTDSDGRLVAQVQRADGEWVSDWDESDAPLTNLVEEPR